jgi:uncharacterized protein (TIGR03435 family)
MTERAEHRIDLHRVSPLIIVSLMSIAALLLPQTAIGQATATKEYVVPTWMTVAGGKKEFDIASVKQNKSDESRPDSNMPLGPGDVYVPTGGVFSAKALPLTEYVDFAYKVTNNQRSSLNSQMPDWARSERYDIEARCDDHNATKDQMRLMMQSLLADRFKLAIRMEIRQVPVFALVLSKPGKTGPQLQPHPASDASCSTAPSEAETGMFPASCGGILGMQPTTPGDDRAAARNVSMDVIASFLSGLGGGINRPVLDQTGLSGKFDFSLEWAPESNRPPPISADAGPVAQGPPALEALKEQLGLKLEPAKGPVETIVIEHVELPSPN